MSQITVTVHNKPYTIACQEGQEDILRQVAEDFDGRLRHLSESFPAADRDYLMVFANLMMADEIKALNTKMTLLNRQKTEDIPPDVLALRLDSLAQTIEAMVDTLTAKS